MFQALRIRDFRLLWAGSIISDLGSWLLTLAVPAHVFLVTGSLRATGLTLAAQYLPVLVLGPVAGVFTDRWDRRRLMIATDLFRAGAVATMLLGISPARPWVLYAALIAESGGDVLYTPAAQARTPAIVGTGALLSSANSLIVGAGGVVRLIGGPLGGILLALYGIKWLICADAVSYLLSAAANFLTTRASGERAGRAGSAPADRRTTARDVTHDLIEGARTLRNQPIARALLPVTVVFLLFSSSSLATALPAAVAVGMFGSVSLVILQTAVQRVIPDAALGRVSAVFLAAEAAATLTGAVAGPFVAKSAGFTGIAAVASLVTLGGAALACLIVPRMTAPGCR